MVKVVSVEAMRQIEQAANEAGLSFETMFERVGRVVASHLHERLIAVAEPQVTILVGPGNNGGDGLVTARNLVDEGVSVGVYLVGGRADDDPHVVALQGTDCQIVAASDDQQYQMLRDMVAGADLVVDAVLGIGARLPLRDEVVAVFREVAQALTIGPASSSDGILIEADAPTPPSVRRPLVVALDCPSGVNCDTGEVDDNALRADETITFICVKQGLLLEPAARKVGKLHVATLGIPEAHTRDELIDFAHSRMIQKMMPDRAETGHKGSNGKALIVAGSVNYSGAAGLAAYAAYRSGAGLVTLAAPMPVITQVGAQMLEPTWILLPHDMGVISEAAADVIVKELDTYDALLIGPGLGREDTTRDMLVRLLRDHQEAAQRQRKEAKRQIGFAGLARGPADEAGGQAGSVVLPPLVLDADALNLLADVDDWPALLPADTVLTPHPGEMGRLAGMDIDAIQADRVRVAQQKAAEWGVVLLLKGPHTVVAASDGRTAILPFKTSALATAGTGDVLAGMIVSLLGQGVPAYEAALVSGYIHGSAGVMAANLMGSPNGVMAGDVLDLLSDIIGEFI